MKSFSCAIIVFGVLFARCVTSPCFAQIPHIQYQRQYGGSGSDQAAAIVRTDDGYVFAGSTSSTDSGIVGLHGKQFNDFWIVKCNGSGAIQWSRVLGGTDGDQATGMVQTLEGGYAVVGSTSSTNADVPDNHGNTDFWVVKLTANGYVEWKHAFGGTLDDLATSIALAANGDLIVGGTSKSMIAGHHGDSSTQDYLVVRLNSAGDTLWRRSIGGSRNDVCNAVAATADNGCVIAGSTLSTDGDFTMENHGGGDFGIVKLDSMGTVVWKHMFGGSSADIPYAIIVTLDDDVVAAGYSFSTDGDVTGNKGLEDLWIVRTDQAGNLKWQRSYGGSGYDYAAAIAPQIGRGFLIAGNTTSVDGDAIGNTDLERNCWLLRIDDDGDLMWQTAFGNPGYETVGSLVQIDSSGCLFAGGTFVDQGGSPIPNAWIVDLGVANGVAAEQQTPAPGDLLLIYPNPTRGDATAIMGGRLEHGSCTLDVMDMNGHIIHQESSKLDAARRATFDVSKVPSGTYTVRLTADGKTRNSGRLQVVK